jgi:hypothetical protein
MKLDRLGDTPEWKAIERTIFQLENPPPKPKPYQPVPVEKCRQKVLLTGLDCLAGQQELFNT